MKTIDLELAKELQSLCKEKNLTMPDGYNWWIKNKGNKDIYTFPVQYIHPAECLEILAPAYTLDEILEWLPKYIQIDDDDENDFDVYYRGLNWSIDPDGWIAEYQAYMYHSKSYCAEFDPNPANAACKLLIYLIKEGLYDTRRD
jgi:ABC-type glycerol-3-phosphate transport system substrate-binding protein